MSYFFRIIFLLFFANTALAIETFQADVPKTWHSDFASACEANRLAYSSGAGYVYDSVTLQQSFPTSYFDMYQCRYKKLSDGTFSTLNSSLDVRTYACTGGRFWNNTTHACVLPPTCTPPQVNNPTTGVCENPVICTENKKLSGTYYTPARSGLTNANATTADGKVKTCTDGCETALDPSGIPFYVATSGANTFIEGNLKQTGTQCVAGTAGSQTSTTSPTEKECQSKGQGYITANGTTSCVANGTAGATNPINTGEKSTTTGSGTSKTETNTTVNNDNSVTTTTTTTNPDGTTSTKSETQDKPSFCEQNPNAQICKESDEPDGNVPGNPKGYDRAENRFYETKYEEGAQGIWDNFKDEIDQTSAMNAMEALTPNLGDGGTPPTWTFSFNLGQNMNFGSYTLEPDSGIWIFIRICIIITALWAARAIIFGG